MFLLLAGTTFGHFNTETNSRKFELIFKNPNFHTRCFGPFAGFPCQSHAPFQRSIAPPERIRVAKNTGSANDFAHFEQIDKMQPKNTITMSTKRSQNYTRRGITLQA